MRSRWHGIATLALGAVILGGSVLDDSADASQATSVARPTAIVGTLRSGVEDLTEFLGIGEEAPVPPGTLDDGQGLLPQATISLHHAIQAAQQAVSGSVGEVDLEYFNGRLVFNVDIGDSDVKVDAATAEILGTLAEE